jgi:hypothetical protein
VITVKAPRAALMLALALGWLALPAGLRAGSKPAELEGFGKAKFGMSEEQVKALYPELQESPLATPKPGEAPLPFSLSNYGLENRSFGPLKKCKVWLQFFEHQLTSVQYTCAGGSEKITRYLKKRFGPPQQVSARQGLSWVLGDYSVTEMAVPGVFTIFDTARSRQMSGVIMGLVMQKMAAATATPMMAPPSENTAPPATPETPK